MEIFFSTFTFAREIVFWFRFEGKNPVKGAIWGNKGVFECNFEGEKKEYNTLGSQVIPDLSTNNAWSCLTSQIGRDTVFSA